MARGGPPSLPEPPGMPEPSKLREHAVAFVRRFFPALLLLLWVRTCVVEPFYIPSVSMYPTLTVNDQIAVEKFSRYWADPSRGDLIVFKAPEARGSESHQARRGRCWRRGRSEQWGGENKWRGEI